MTAAAVVRALVAGPLGDAYRDDAMLDALGMRFATDGYVRLPDLLSNDAMDVLRTEIAALEPTAQSRDFVMPGPGTPRVMSVLGATQLLDGATAPAILYAHFELVRLISRVAGTAVHVCPHPEELMVCNFLLTSGATHGWHLDDPPYALVIVLEAPAAGAGGELEYIAGWEGLCAAGGLDPGAEVEAAVVYAHDTGAVRTAHHEAGDAYLLRADRCLHQVAPLRRGRGRRVALNFAYEQTADADYGDSATLLYGGGQVLR